MGRNGRQALRDGQLKTWSPGKEPLREILGGAGIVERDNQHPVG